MQHEECKTCEYWDRYMWLCDYASSEGKTRIALNGGNWRKLYVGKCDQWKQSKKKKKKAGYAWRELHDNQAKSSRKK